MRFLWVPLISAVLCLSAHAAPAPWPQPQPPDQGDMILRGLAERWAELFGAGKSEPEGGRLTRLRRRLESESDPAARCALLHDLYELEASRSNFTQAIADVQTYLGTCGLTSEQRRQALLRLGNLYLMLDPPDTERAILTFREYAAGAEASDPDAHLYLGLALALAGRCSEGIREAQKAIELAKEPREDDYRLLLFCRREDPQESIVLAEKMLTLFPAKDEYLTLLAASYYRLGRVREAFLLAALRYEMGYLHSEEELVAVARLYVWFNNPSRAARLLEKEMRAGHVRRTPENLEILAGIWSAGREDKRARDTLIEAAAGRKNGQLEFRIALSYLDAGDRDKAVFYLRRALSKGGLVQPCAAHMLLAFSLYDGDEKSGALEQFRQAETAGCRPETERALQGLAAEIAGNGSDIGSMRARLLYERIPVMAARDERAFAASAEALGAARAALATPTAKLRGIWLAEYEGARAAAGRHLDAGALKTAREDRASIEMLRAALPADRLPPETLARVRRLDGLCRRRVALLEGARDNLNQAATFAVRARRKAASQDAQ